MKLDGCHALVTGASAGLGQEFARQLAGRAQSLLLVARRQKRLEELRDQLRAQNPSLIVRLCCADLSESAGIESLIAEIERENIPLNLLINNAGLGDLGLLRDSEPERLRQMMMVNMVALTMLTRRVLPRLLANQPAGVLNVSSSASFLPIAGFAVYAATKAYVTSFSEAIRAELRGAGVSVTALCPGPVHTEFTSVAHRDSGADAELGPDFIYVTPEDVVGAALRGMENDRPLVIPGLFMKIGMALVRLTPMPILRLASRFSAKTP